MTDLPIRGCEWKAGEKPAILRGAVGCETYVSIASLVSSWNEFSWWDAILICPDNCVFAKLEEAT